MAKILRKNMKVFGSNAGAFELGEFGSLAAGTPTYTNDPETIQSLSNYLDGWFAAVLGGNSPAIQDMNALCFLFAYQLSYILQTGVGEWNSLTTYYIGSVVNDGFGVLYVSRTDNNLNNALTSAANWELRDRKVRTVTASTTIVATDGVVRFNATGGAITQAIPSAASSPVGMQFSAKNVSTDGSQVTLTSADGMDGQSSLILNSDPVLDSVTLSNAGTTWDII